MGKIKTVKGVKWRIKVTGTGKLIAAQPGRRHLLGGKRSKIKRHLRGSKALSPSESRATRALIPYV